MSESVVARPPGTLERWGVWIGIAAIGATFAALLTWTWDIWPDVLIDFGRELYVPWQLAQGKTLYTDIAYFNGPLSPYFNALVFKLFGAGLTTLVWTNAAMLLGIVVLLYSLLRELAGALTATVACFVFLALFGFPQYVGVGNYNYLPLFA